MTEQKQEGYRLMHHSRRIPLCADSKSAGPYFAVIKEDFTILYPEQTPKDLYRYELQYYQDTFTEWAEEKRENHIKSRHARRIQTPRTIYENPQRCPEELTVQIGTQAGSLKADAVLSCMNDYLQWTLSLAQNGEAPHILWAAVEKKAPYRMIIRRVWTYLDENGIYKISQTKLLNRMGFYPEGEGETKFQNIKIEFDQISRKMMEEICMAHGITLKGIPRISTLRQAMDWYKTVQAESHHAKQLLTGLTKREEESSAEELESLTVHRTDGSIIIPETAYRMLILKQVLGELYAIQEATLTGEAEEIKKQEAASEYRKHVAEAGLSEAKDRYVALSLGFFARQDGRSIGGE